MAAMIEALQRKRERKERAMKYKESITPTIAREIQRKSVVEEQEYNYYRQCEERKGKYLVKQEAEDFSKERRLFKDYNGFSHTHDRGIESSPNKRIELDFWKYHQTPKGLVTPSLRSMVNP